MRILLASLTVFSLNASPAGAFNFLAPGTRYILLEVPGQSDIRPATQTYRSPEGLEADPWTFAHGVLTLIDAQAGSRYDFRAADGRTLRVTTSNGRLLGLFPIQPEPVLTKAWAGQVWPYGRVDYACLLNQKEQVSMATVPVRPLNVVQVYQVYGTVREVAMRGMYGGGVLYTSAPVPAVRPLLVQFDNAAFEVNTRPLAVEPQQALETCKQVFVPYFGAWALERNLSRVPLPAARLGERGQTDIDYRGWTKAEIEQVFGTPDQPGTRAQIMALNRWTFNSFPEARFDFSFTFKGGRVVEFAVPHRP